MAEMDIIAEGQTISYEGLFSVRELYKIINTWFSEHGYDRQEVENTEIIGEKGKQIILYLWPYKKMSDYVKFEIRIYIVMKEVTDVEVEVRGRKMHCQRGNISLSFDALLVTDYEGSFATMAITFFLKQVFDKFMFKLQLSQFKDQLMKHYREIQDEVRGFLNMHRYG